MKTNLTDTTSALGPMRVLPVTGPLVLTGALALFGTSATPASAVAAQVRSAMQRTNSGGKTVHSNENSLSGDSDEDPTLTSSALMELRRISGLTWDQLARLFDVDRRSLHFWASGKAMNAQNEERLRRTLDAVKVVFLGSAGETRAMLFSGTEGETAFDLLAAGAYRDVVERFGRFAAPTRPELPPLSAEARLARTPRPPEELIDALQDRVHVSKGAGRLIGTTPIQRGRKG